MPYLAQSDRENPNLWEDYDGVCYPSPENSGELNFVLSTIISDYIARNGLRYSKIADVLSAVEGAKFEFLRRVVAPYEDLKIRENGDLDPYKNVEAKMRQCGAKPKAC